MKKSTAASFFIAFLLLISGALAFRGQLSLMAYRHDINFVSALCWPEFVLANDVAFKGSGNQEHRIRFIEYFGKSRAVKALKSATDEKQLGVLEMIGWIKIYHKISTGLNSLPLLKSWLSESTKWDVLNAYFFDADYYASSMTFPQELVFESQYPWEYRLFSAIWGTSSDDERAATLAYWISVCKKSENSGADYYLLSALSRKGNDKIVQDLKDDINKIKSRLPANSPEVRSFVNAYQTQDK